MTQSNWADPAKLQISGGQWHSSDGTSGFRLSVEDDYSGLRVIELELTPQQVLSLLSGTMMTVDGWLAKPLLLSRLGWKRVRDTIQVPHEAYAGKGYVRRQESAVKNWYEEQPGSGEVDGYYVKFEHGLWKIHTWTWVPRDVYEAGLALDLESEEPDLDDDGLDEDEE